MSLRRLVTRFKDYIPNLISSYHRENDSYKDTEGNGILVRFIQAHGEELDEFVKFSESYLNIRDIDLTEIKFIQLIAHELGNPPDIFLDDDKYRKILRNTVSIYKYKGTRKSFEMFFGVLGFDISIIEYDSSFNNVIDIEYDESYNYDGNYSYDGLGSGLNCSPCSYYDIIFNYVDYMNMILPQLTWDLLNIAIEFNQPINALIYNITFQLPLDDTIYVILDDDEDHDVIKVPTYDSEFIYDDIEEGIIYDAITPLAIEGIQNGVITLLQIGISTIQITLNIDDNMLLEEESYLIIEPLDINGNIIDSLMCRIMQINVNELILTINGYPGVTTELNYNTLYIRGILYFDSGLGVISHRHIVNKYIPHGILTTNLLFQYQPIL